MELRIQLIIDYQVQVKKERREKTEGAITGKVPLAVLDEEVPRQKEECQGQEEEERVIEVLVADAVDVSEVPSQPGDLRVQGEGDTEGCH